MYHNDHPVCAASEASRLFLNGAATPPVPGGEHPVLAILHTFIDRRYSEGVHMKNTIRRVFGCLAVLAITLAFASLGAAGGGGTSTVLFPQFPSWVEQLPRFFVYVFLKGAPGDGGPTIWEKKF